MTTRAFFSSLVLATIGCSHQGRMNDSSSVKNVNFLDPTLEDIQAAGRSEDSLKPLSEFGSLPLREFNSAFTTSGGRSVSLNVKVDKALFLPLHFGNVPMNTSEATLTFYQSFATAAVGAVDEATFADLKSTFWPESSLVYQAGRSYELKHFLPPMMQGLMNRRGLGTVVDCFATAYARLVDVNEVHLISRKREHMGFEDGSQYERVLQVDASNPAAVLESLKPIKFGDLVVFGSSHIATAVTPGLLWEKANAGTTPFRLIDTGAVVDFWKSEAQGEMVVEVFRPRPGLRLEKIESQTLFNPRFGNQTEHAEVFALRLSADQTFEVVR